MTSTELLNNALLMDEIRGVSIGEIRIVVQRIRSLLAHLQIHDQTLLGGHMTGVGARV